MKKHNQSILKLCLLIFVIFITVQVVMIPGAFCSTTPINTSDPNEATVVDSRDFSQLTLTPTVQDLYILVSFYAYPSFNQFFFYMNTDTNPVADIQITCFPLDFELRKSSTPNSGVYDILVYSDSSTHGRGGSYGMVIPWDKIGVNSFNVWVYDSTSRDRLPDTGSVAVLYPRIEVNDPNETAVMDNQDFKTLTMLSGSVYLESQIEFYSAPSFSEFFFYMNTDATQGANLVALCHQGDFSLYTSSIPDSGYYDVLLYTGTASISGNVYTLNIPWFYIPATSFTVWLYNISSLDTLPDSGVIPVTK